MTDFWAIAEIFFRLIGLFKRDRMVGDRSDLRDSHHNRSRQFSTKLQIFQRRQEMETSLESLLSQLETAYYNAKAAYRDPGYDTDERVSNAYERAQTQRQAIKDEILARFSRIENELRGYQNF
jgi:hypothetical protein